MVDFSHAVPKVKVICCKNFGDAEDLDKIVPVLENSFAKEFVTCIQLQNVKENWMKRCSDSRIPPIHFVHKGTNL